MEKIKIDLDEQLVPGDIIELHYKTIGLVWFTAAQMAAIEWRLKSRSNFQLLSTSLRDNLLIIKIRIVAPKEEVIGEVQQAGIITVGAVVGIVAAIIGVVMWVTFEGAYKLAEKSEEILQTAPGSILAIGGAAVIGALAIALLLRK